MAAIYPDDELFADPRAVAARRNDENDPLIDGTGQSLDDGGELDTRVQRAQEQLMALRRQQEFIERQKRELEELGRKQDELARGRTELSGLIGTALIHVDRESFEAEKRIETLRQAREILSLHQREIAAIDPKSWTEDEVQARLATALSEIEAARVDYERMRVRISQREDGDDLKAYQEEAAMGEEDFLTVFKRGLAFTLPLILFGLLVLIVWMLRAPLPPAP